jgi:hypothetical protein
MALALAGAALASSFAVAAYNLDTRDAVLGPPVAAVTVQWTKDSPCHLLLESPDGTCGSAFTENTGALYTIDPGRPVDDVLVSRPWVVRVYRPTDTANEWQTVLETPRDDNGVGPIYADVSAEFVDLTSFSSSELLVGYRSEGTGQILDLDIVSTNLAPQVLAHVQLYKGVAKVKRLCTLHCARGKPSEVLVTWTPVYKKLEANCCPSWIRRDVVRFEHGAFVVHHGKKVPTEDAAIPPGDF